MSVVKALITCAGPNEIIWYAIAYVIHIEIVPPTVRSEQNDLSAILT